MENTTTDTEKTWDSNGKRAVSSMDACRRVCREHPVTVAAAGLAVAATLALLCVGLMRHHRW